MTVSRLLARLPVVRTRFDDTGSGTNVLIVMCCGKPCYPSVANHSTHTFWPFLATTLFLLFQETQITAWKLSHHSNMFRPAGSTVNNYSNVFRRNGLLQAVASLHSRSSPRQPQSRLPHGSSWSHAAQISNRAHSDEQQGRRPRRRVKKKRKVVASVSVWPRLFPCFLPLRWWGSRPVAVALACLVLVLLSLLGPFVHCAWLVYVVSCWAPTQEPSNYQVSQICGGVVPGLRCEKGNNWKTILSATTFFLLGSRSIDNLMMGPSSTSIACSWRRFGFDCGCSVGRHTIHWT